MSNENSEPIESIGKSKQYQNPHNAIFLASDGFEEIGQSAGGHPLMIKRLRGENQNLKKILLIGGVHGNETEGVAFMEGFCREFGISTNKAFHDDIDLFLFPVLNPDGFFGFKRSNDNGVDLNRNMSTKDWQSEAIKPKYYPGPSANSEPETKALIDLLHHYSFDFIISFHSWKPMVNINGPADTFADIIAQKLGYITTRDIGYPTPGSLGTWAGWERNIPTITLEFERGMELDKVYPFARDAIIDSIGALLKQ